MARDKTPNKEDKKSKKKVGEGDDKKSKKEKEEKKEKGGPKSDKDVDKKKKKSSAKDNGDSSPPSLSPQPSSGAADIFAAMGLGPSPSMASVAHSEKSKKSKKDKQHDNDDDDLKSEKSGKKSKKDKKGAEDVITEVPSLDPKGKKKKKKGDEESDKEDVPSGKKDKKDKKKDGKKEKKGDKEKTKKAANEEEPMSAKEKGKKDKKGATDDSSPTLLLPAAKGRLVSESDEGSDGSNDSGRSLSEEDEGDGAGVRPVGSNAVDPDGWSGHNSDNDDDDEDRTTPSVSTPAATTPRRPTAETRGSEMVSDIHEEDDEEEYEDEEEEDEEDSIYGPDVSAINKTSAVAATPPPLPLPPQRPPASPVAAATAQATTNVIGRSKGPDPFAAPPPVAWCGLTLKLPTATSGATDSYSAAVLRRGTNAFERLIIVTDAPHPNASEAPQYDSDFGQILVCLPPPCLSKLDPPSASSRESDGALGAKLKSLPFEQLIEGGVTRVIDLLLIDSIHVYGKNVDRATMAALRDGAGGEIQEVLDSALRLSLYPIPDGASPQPPLALGFTAPSRALRGVKGVTEMSAYLGGKHDAERLQDEINRIRGEATTRYRHILDPRLAARVRVPPIRTIRDGIMVGGIRKSSLNPISHSLSPDELVHNPLHPSFRDAQPGGAEGTINSGLVTSRPQSRSMSGVNTPLHTPLHTSTSRRHSVLGEAPLSPFQTANEQMQHHINHDRRGAPPPPHHQPLVAPFEEENGSTRRDLPVQNEAAVMGYPQGNYNDPYRAEPGAWRLRDTIAEGANSPQRGLLNPNEVSRQLERQQEATQLGTNTGSHPQGAASPVGYPQQTPLPVDPHHAAETAVMARLLRQSQMRSKDLQRECEELQQKGEEMYAMVLVHQQQVVAAEKQVLAIEREKEEVKAHYEGELQKVRKAFSDFDTQINAYIRTMEESHKAALDQVRKELVVTKESASKEREALKKKVEEARSSTRYQEMLMAHAAIGGGVGVPRRRLSLGDVSLSDDGGGGSRLASEYFSTSDGGGDGGRWISDKDLNNLVQHLQRYRDATRGPVVPSHSDSRTSTPRPGTPVKSTMATPNKQHPTGNATGYASMLANSRATENGFQNAPPQGAGIHEYHAPPQSSDYSHPRAATPPLNARRTPPPHQQQPTRASGTNNGSNTTGGTPTKPHTPVHGLPQSLHLAGAAAVEERLNQYRADLQKSTSVKRSLEEYKQRIKEEHRSKIQYETNRSLLGPPASATDDSSATAVQKRLQRFLHEDDPALDENLPPPTPTDTHGDSHGRREGKSRSASESTSLSSTTDSSSDQDEDDYTLEEQEEPYDERHHQRQSNRRRGSAATHDTVSSKGADAKDASRKQQRKDAKRERRRLAYEKALDQYERHKQQEGYYKDEYADEDTYGDARRRDGHRAKSQPNRHSTRQPPSSTTRHDGLYSGGRHHHQRHDERHFADVDVDDRGYRGKQSRGAPTAVSSSRVSHPSIGLPTRRGDTPTRVPLLDSKSYPHNSSTPHRTNSPFHHRDRSIL